MAAAIAASSRRRAAATASARTASSVCFVRRSDTSGCSAISDAFPIAPPSSSPSANAAAASFNSTARSASIQAFVYNSSAATCGPTIACSR